MRRPSLRDSNGVAATSQYVRDYVREKFREALAERRTVFHKLSEEEMNSEATIVGEIARRATLQALVNAYQMGAKAGKPTGTSADDWPVAELVPEWPSETLRKTVVENLKTKLLERRISGRHEMPNDEIDAQARVAGLLAKEAAEPAIGEIHRMGVDRNATKEQHERATIPSPVPGGRAFDADARLSPVPGGSTGNK